MKRFSEAERDLLEVLQIQLEVLGKDRVDYWVTLQLLGLAQFSVTKFAEARATLTKTEDGLRKLLGPSHILFLITRLYRGYVLERQAELKQAFELYDEVWQKWTSVMGQSGAFSLMLQTAIGSVCRKRKQFDLAKKSLQEAWEVRLRIFTIDNNVCLDSAMQLALTNRDDKCPEDARKMLEVISSSKIFETDFERYCQITHIGALLDLDEGQYPEPRLILEKLLASAITTRRMRLSCFSLNWSSQYPETKTSSMLVIKMKT